MKSIDKQFEELLTQNEDVLKRLKHNEMPEDYYYFLALALAQDYTITTNASIEDCEYELERGIDKIEEASLIVQTYYNGSKKLADPCTDETGLNIYLVTERTRGFKVLNPKIEKIELVFDENGNVYEFSNALMRRVLKDNLFKKLLERCYEEAKKSAIEYWKNPYLGC